MSLCGWVPNPAGVDYVIVNHAQRGETHKVRVVVVGERESMPESSQPWLAWPRSLALRK